MIEEPRRIQPANLLLLSEKHIFLISNQQEARDAGHRKSVNHWAGEYNSDRENGHLFVAILMYEVFSSNGKNQYGTMEGKNVFQVTTSSLPEIPKIQQ
jgi:hypothetical protein